MTNGTTTTPRLVNRRAVKVYMQGFARGRGEVAVDELGPFELERLDAAMAAKVEDMLTRRSRRRP